MANVAEVEIRYTAVGDAEVEAKSQKVRKSIRNVRVDLFSLKNALAAGGFYLIAQNIGQAALEMERMEGKIAAATGGGEAAAREMAFVRFEAKRLGLELRSAGNDFGTLAASAKGTSLAGQQIRDIFTAVAEASTVMKLSAEQTSGSILAIGQMISKGTVSAEELRGQLGERLPGAFQAAARSMNVTTAELGKMLERGEIMAEDFLPRFAQELRKTFAEELPNAVDSAQSKINRFSNVLFELKVRLADSGMMDGFVASLDWFSNTFVPNAEAMMWSLVAGLLKGWEYLSHGMQGLAGRLVKFIMLAWEDISYWGNIAWETIKQSAQSAVKFAVEMLATMVEAMGRMIARLPGDAAAASSAAAMKSAESLREQVKELGNFKKAYDQLGKEHAQARTDIIEVAGQIRSDLDQKLIAGIRGINEIAQENITKALNQQINVEAPMADGGQGKGDEEDKLSKEQVKLLEQLQQLELAIAGQEAMLMDATQRRVDMVESATEQGLITEIRGRELTLQIEEDYLKKLTKMRIAGMTKLQKFEQMALKEKTKFALSEAVRMTQGVAQSSRAMFEVNKAARLAEAGMELVSGTIKTFNSYPYPWNLAMTALHVATGVAQISQLSSASYGGGQSSPSIGYGGGTPTSPIVTESPGGRSREDEGTKQEINIHFPPDMKFINSTPEEFARSFVPALREAMADGA